MLSPIQRRRIAAISAANRQSGGEVGCYSEKFRIFLAWAEPGTKTAFFRVLGYLSGILNTAYRKQFYPQTNGTDGKPRLWRCAFC